MRSLLNIMVCVFILPQAFAAGPYGGGTGTPGDPYLISTASQMNTIGTDPNDWDKHFKLTANIDLGAYTGTAYNIIGRDGVGDFTGTFDGDNRTISNFKYQGFAPHSGIFGRLVGATVSDLNVIDVDITWAEAFGAIAGYVENSTISNCYVAGVIVAFEKSGGLVGHFKTGLITKCRTAVNVEGYFEKLGGLVGYNESGTIEKSKVTKLVNLGIGAIEITNDGDIGGLVGTNAGVIKDCYSDIGSVTSYAATSAAGGLVGTNDGTVIRCYSNAIVSGSAALGGLVGINNGFVADSFWDTELSWIGVSDGGTGKTHAEMKIQSTFTSSSWDFVGESENGTEDIWAILEGDDYPRLADSVFYGIGTGTQADPFLLSTPEQFNSFGRAGSTQGKYFSLTKDLNFALYPNDALMPPGSFGGDVFKGIFDGNGHTIYDYSYAPPVSQIGYCGLFGYADGAQIQNLNMVNLYIYDNASLYTAGSFVASGNNTKIINCNVSGVIVSGGETGGIAARLEGSGSAVTDCWSNCTVSGYGTVGGLVGYTDGTIANGYALGNITASSTDVGGIVGKTTGDITNCYLQGNVYGTDNVGGIVGLTSGNIMDCHAIGDVYSDGSDSGGIAGDISGNLTKCWSRSVVSGVDNVGGLAGSSTGDIISSYALGDVVGSGSYAGGLVGHSVNGIISMSSAKGNVSATGSYGGGLIGYKDNGDIVMCYALGNVSSAETGGLVGRSQSSTNIYDSFAHGHVTNTDSLGNAGGLIGYANGGSIYGCYSVGIISGLATLKGGLVGDGFGHSVYDSYWDIEISQQPTSSGGGVGLPTRDMKKQLTYAGWDFDTVWRIEEGFNYPLHREFPIGDLNLDRKVDFFDLVIMSNHWLEDFNI